jgi:hypothetical protein
VIQDPETIQNVELKTCNSFAKLFPGCAGGKTD